MVEKIIIIGSGPAGLSAAIYAAREGFEPLLIAGSKGGGQLELTTVVENFPGFPDGVNGPDVVKFMKKQAEKFGTRFIEKDVEEVYLKSKPIKVTVEEKIYETDSLIIATGANAKWLGLPSESKFIGKGVSSCGTCDGPFFKNKDVIVVGGGDTAMEDSIFLTKFANSVTIVHRKDTLKASKIMQERAKSNKKIKFIWNSVIEEILGDAKVTGVKIKNIITNEISEIKIDGIFVAIGYKPNTEIFKNQLKLDENGYIETIDEIKTDIDGVYIAGDVADKYYRQAITASASGVKCALHAREYLSNLYYNKEKENKK
ncbi:MAG: thioredoxin-disulfide reductase [Candidatus Micrarchaeaceae archaeon]